MSPDTAALEVLSAGFHTTVQDLGRHGFQNLGVPVSGALDSLSLRVANGLLGNDEGSACFEILYHGPTFRVLRGSVRIALSSGSVQIPDDPELTIDGGRSVSLREGQSFRLVCPGTLACCYLAVQGGLLLEPLLGSQSTFVRGGFGGFQGRQLRAGDVVPLRRSTAASQDEVQLKHPLPDRLHDPIRVVLGPQSEFFTGPAIAAFLSEEFGISGSSDRMGMRLDGPRIAHRDGYNIVSDGIATGAIQVPGSGQPVVLLADHQTTGGYPKIGGVISADVPAVGRRRVGGRIRFKAVSLQEAVLGRREQEQALVRAIATRGPVAPAVGVDVDALYSANLVSGVENGIE